MRRFVWTEKGNRVHISEPRDNSVWTTCGWRVDGDVDAGDVLYFELCARCRRHVEAAREREGDET